jgi:ribosomal protein S18 acetylase RimI-like enzyme
MPLAVNIRKAAADDWPQIWAMLEPVLREAEVYALPQDWHEGEARSHWFHPSNDVFVTEIGGKLVGTYYVHANALGGGSHIANCAYLTAAAARGQGIARAMGLHSFATAKARGFRAMQFNFVVSTNAPAVKLWRDLGFAEVGRLPGAFRHPTRGFVDVFVMYKDL